MAPEMYKKSHRGPAADIYSLGFGRQRIWENLDGAEIMLKILGAFNCPPRAPCTTHLVPVYDYLCSQMCSLDATLRPSSDQVLSLMKQIADTQS